MKIEVKELQTIDYDVLKQVDRSENVRYQYSAVQSPTGFGLELQRTHQDPIIYIPSWDDEGIWNRISSWKPQLEKGGTILAAIQNKKIIGFGIIGPKHPDTSVELCALFISSEYRRTGAGTILFRALEEKARKQGGVSLLIYSNPTESSVDFYLKQGCEIIGLADKRLVPHLAWDVVFAKPI